MDSARAAGDLWMTWDGPRRGESGGRQSAWPRGEEPGALWTAEDQMPTSCTGTATERNQDCSTRGSWH